jgi:hypothetical protein
MASTVIVNQTQGRKKSVDHGNVKVNALVPCCGGCCYTVNYYSDCADCFGCTNESTCCCCMDQCKCCKCTDSGESEKKICFTLNENGCYCVQLTTCCTQQGQCCCCDSRQGIPCNDTSPCVFNICFLNICANFKCACKCCANWATLMPEKYGEDVSNVSITVVNQPVVQMAPPVVVQAKRY